MCSGNAPISTGADIYSFGICALEVINYTYIVHDTCIYTVLVCIIFEELL